MLGVSGAGNLEVRECEEHLLSAVMKAETVLTAPTVISGGRKSNGSKISICYSYLVAIPEKLHAVSISTGKWSLFTCREDSTTWD